ncbi:hypothetical protein JXK06_02955 [Patescibacteria group bacterium]|nr:hypothetical protein [Patescibacteria group bacterium]
MKNFNKKNQAYITIMTVISISAVSVAVIISLVYSGISSNRDSAALIDLSFAKYYANACLEESLQKIQENKSYTGTLNLNFSDGSCSALTTRNSDSSFELEALGLKNKANKKIRVIVNETSPKINIFSWQELP